jgi:hypothetical protein
MTKKILLNTTRFFVLAVFCLALGVGQAVAQSTVTGGINGNVTDPQGAVVPNASVTATNVNTNQTATTTTDAGGGFRITNLQPGTYSVRVSGTGFAEFIQERVIVEVGRATPINVPLTVSGQTATVQVTSEAPVINTNSQDFATNINEVSINELPINGRRWSNFALLTPATVPDGNFGLISFRGISGLLNNNTVDGGDNNQAFFSEERGRTRISYVISQSAIREFQVNTSNYSAEYGRSAGGVVNAVTKSGTNQFRGELFYYNRDNKRGARNPLSFQTVINNGVSSLVGLKPEDVRHQFGGAIGGPIIKDRLFFFFSYDQQKRNFPGVATFFNLNYLNTANRSLLLSRGLTNTQIDSALNFLASLTGEVPRRADQTLYLPKIDWQITNNNLFSISYNRLRAESPSGVQTAATVTRGRASFGDDFVEVDSVNARLQSTISSNVLNEARFQWGRDFESQVSNPSAPGEPTTANGRSPSVSLTNGLTFGKPNFLERAAYPDERRIQFANTVTWTRGRHTIKFGGDINRVTDDTQNLFTEAGSYAYNNINDFIVDYVNFAQGLPASTQCATGTRTVGRCYTSNYQQGLGAPGLKFSTTDYNFFIQDDFRITPRLTLNLGLRYEYQQLPDPIIPSSSTTVIPYVNRTLAEATSTLPDDKDNFGPRLGFAYDLTGDGKTTLRGGWGVYYGRLPNSTLYNALINTGNPAGQCLVSIAPTASNALIFPNVLPSAACTASTGAIQFYSEDFQNPEIQQYDLIFEREIFRNTAVSASYIGSRGKYLPTFFDRNLVRNGTITTFTINGGPFAGRTFDVPQYSRVIGTQAITEISSSVTSEYNALVLQATRRFTRGLQFQTSYTLASAQDTGQNSQTFTTANSPFDVFDLSLERGPSNFDVRHKFVVSAVYSPTLYRGNNNSFYGYLLNGWTMSPIYTYFSGRPLDGGISGGTLNGTFGDNRLPIIPRNQFRSPSLHNVDLRLSKRFRFTETINLEFLAEAFNLFNRTQITGVNTTLYTRTGTNLNYNDNFGVTSAAGNTLYRERQIQLAARFRF